MPMTWGGNRSSWDFQNPRNWVINKPLSQNLNELSTGIQVIGLVIPEALAYKAASQIGIATSKAAVATTTAAPAATAGGAGLGTLGAVSGASLISLATTGAKIGFDVYLLEWLKKNWWIPAILIGAYAGVKLIK